ncbi:MAG: outer membrane beta-barrel protein [Bacteroidetes bacterium]|nr:outer membrane beta-barrel protein [Bacteroidota bacterium]
MKNKTHSLDDFFLDVLGDHAITPSGKARELFLKDVASLDFKLPVYRRWYFFPMIILLILMGIMGIWFGTGMNKPGAVKTSAAIIQPGNGIAVPSPITSGNHPQKSSAPAKEYAQISPVREPSHQLVPVKPEEQLIAMNSKPGNLLPNENINTSSLNIPAENPIKPVTGPLVVTGEKADSAPRYKVVSHLLDWPIECRNSSDWSSGRWYFATGVSYTAEWMFNILEANKSMRADNLGLEESFHFGPFSVGTGIGLSITKGTNEMVIGYNDYLGTYRGLDSIVFKWDISHTHIIPIYYYTDKEVYDSLLRLNYSYYEKRYIYLQIPLKLGYDLIRNNNFSLGVRIGPTLSVLLQSRAKSASYNLGKDRIVRLNDVTPDRVATNWQFSAGINAWFRMNRRFGLEVEPDFRHYFNSVYEKPDNTKKPWSAGFRIALIIRN